MGGLLLTVLELIGAFASYAATPQQAALRAVYSPAGQHAVVARMNIVGRYATVLTRDAFMEGSPTDAPILLERFSFGWQPLESLNFRCRLDEHAISIRDKALLMRGMPKLQSARACGGVDGDAGPVAQVEAIRRQMLGPLVPFVIVSGAFAMGQWYGGGGGLDAAELRAHGVPPAALCAFGVYDAKCPPKRPTSKS